MVDNIIEDIHKHLDKAFKEVLKDYKERVEPFVEKVRKSIKHPHFYYAIVDTENLTAEYKRKKWYQWFSGKRIVHIKFKPWYGPDLPDYTPMNKQDLYGWIPGKENKDE